MTSEATAERLGEPRRPLALLFWLVLAGLQIAAINGGRHVSPCFAGDTVYAWSEILEKAELPGRADVGALRTRLVAVKNNDC